MCYVRVRVKWGGFDQVGDMTQYRPAGWPSTIATTAAAAVSATLLASSSARSASCDIEKRATRH